MSVCDKQQDNNYEYYDKRKKKSKIYCSNCGNFGHVYKKCSDAITSLGIISYYKENEKIKFNMIRRKYTLGYCEFIRGRYSLDHPKTISLLFYQMSNNEIDNIDKHKDIDYLWNELWKNEQKKSKNYKLEYETSKIRFNILLKKEKYNLDYFCENVGLLWNQPEWGFPKGRRNIHENNIECAMREFEEETGYSKKMYTLYKEAGPLVELFHGTNGVHYRHIYYIAKIKSDIITFDEYEKNNNSNEVGDMGYFTYDEALNIIRPYHIEKKEILIDAYQKILEIESETMVEQCISESVN